MKYTFNYMKYARKHNVLVKGERSYVIVEGKMKSHSLRLQYYSLNNDRRQFLLPRTALCFSFAITRDYKQRAKTFLMSKGFSDFEIIARIRELKDSPVFISKNNGEILIFNSPVGDEQRTQFINSSAEKFAESILYHREFYEGYMSNVNTLIKERDATIQQGNSDNINEIFEIDSITGDNVLAFFNKIRRMDFEAAKEGNFWNSYISSDILAHEGHKMKAQNKLAMEEGGYYKFSVENIPSVLDLPAWKVLHP